MDALDDLINLAEQYEEKFEKWESEAERAHDGSDDDLINSETGEVGDGAKQPTIDLYDRDEIPLRR